MLMTSDSFLLKFAWFVSEWPLPLVPSVLYIKTIVNIGSFHVVVILHRKEHSGEAVYSIAGVSQSG